MPAKQMWTHVVRLAGVFIAAAGMLAASEYRGTVTAGGQPLPGVTVTATQGERKLVTTTDERGVFEFADLADGEWTVTLQMPGFANTARQITVAPGVAAAAWEMRFAARRGAAAQAAAGASPAAAPASGAKPSAAAGGRPLRARGTAPAQQGQTAGFQRLEVNQSADAGAAGEAGTISNEELADLTQRAANSFIVQGSMSSAAGLGQQNDWGFGHAGMMMSMGAPGMGGPGGPEGFGGPEMAGGPGGEAGMRTGGFGGRMGGGPGGFGGRGMHGPGRPGGPGGPGEVRRAGAGPGGRPQWQGQRGAMAFGNARRNPRNTYMGMASFSLGNSALDARSYSVTGAQVDKPSYSNFRAGLMFGGPLRIPKLVSADKQIFFSLNYRIQRSRNGVVSDPVNMPTALERTGDFSQSAVGGTPVTIYDPTTGAPFANNRIPDSRIDQTAAALLKYFPLPNLPFAARNYQTAWTGVTNSQALNARVMNARLTEKDRLNGGISYQNSSSVTPNLFAFTDTGSGRGINANVGWSHSISTNLINNVRYTFSRNRQLLTPYFAGVENIAANLGIAGTSQDPNNWGPPNLSFVNYASLSDGNYSLNRNQTSSVGESLMWLRGSHRFAFGGEFRRQQFNQLADTNGRGTYSFNGLATSDLIGGVAQGGTGYDLADFLLGVPTTGSIRYGNADKYFRGSGYSVFFNDDWRATANLSLNAGIRWDYATPVEELFGRLVNLDIAPGFTAVVPVLPGETAPYSGNLPKSLIHPDRNNFSPRFGLAWRPRANHSMVVRAGYGLYYNTSVYNLIAANLAQQPPFAQVLSASNSAETPLTIANGFLLASTTAAGSTYAVDPNYRVGYAQTWSVSIQNDLPLGMFGTIGYLGTKGTRLDQLFIPNSVPPGLPESLYPHGFLYETSNGNSIYHAAQFQLVRRFRSGISARASYQLSKSIDNAGTGGRGQGGTPVAQNWLDLSAERGLSSFDARHNLTVQVQYSTGMGTAGGTLLKGWQGALVKDWTLSGDISVHSGNPFTAIVGGNRSQVAGTAVANTIRANATGQPVEAPGMLFNTAAFVAPPPGEWGNAGRNTIPGPTVFFLNGSLGRVFRVGERRSVDVNMQAQNLLNHVTITSWGTVVGANNYGLATAAAQMRQVTANLRFRF